MRIYPNSSGTSQGRQGEVLQTARMAVCHRTRRRAKQQGFTLIEMMVVMVIMSIIAAVAIPSFSSWREKQAVRNATQALLAQLKQARVLAVSENRSVSLAFTSTTYTFDADTTGSCGSCKNERHNLSQYSSNLLASPIGTRTFSSRGTSSASSIKLTAGSYSKTITMNILGRAYLK